MKRTIESGSEGNNSFSLFDMFRHFGGLPIVKASFAAENEYDVPRATVEETVNFMIGL